ncbi:MAG: hypothetical protein HZC24_12645, partial [Rhodocyclales bacterium]|nr:hypothetical protein [Rhodocyclales bacterium]
GLFAAIFSSLYPALVRGLVLLGAPLHFGADAYMRGSLSVAGRRAAARAFAAPLFAVVDKRCPLVPPASVLPFLDAAASPDQRLAYYAGDIGVGIQHVGPLVGRSAHARLWPEIVRWLWQHWRQAPAAASG